MIEIFISYRRSDSQKQALAIYNALCTLYNPKSIYLDKKNNKMGDKWEIMIDKHLKTSIVMIALIGPIWLDEIKNRVKNKAKDMVRTEIGQALTRENINIFPVLIGSARMPNENELPDDLKSLCGYHAETIIPKNDWDEAVTSFLSKFHERYKGMIQSRRLNKDQTEILVHITTKYPNSEASEPMVYQHFSRCDFSMEKIAGIIKYLETFGFITKPSPKVLKLTKAGMKYLKTYNLIE